LATETSVDSARAGEGEVESVDGGQVSEGPDFDVGYGHVGSGIAAVREFLAEKGLGKNQENKHQNFKFRGIDDLYGILQPALAHGKVILSPDLASFDRKEYVKADGKYQFFTTTTVDYHFESLVDGSTRTYRYAGEAADTGDKSLSKALTMAFKSFCFHVFQIPLNGNDDADKHTPDEVEAPKLDEDTKLTLEAAAGAGVAAFRDAWKSLDKDTRKLAQQDKKWFDGLRETAENMDKKE
jgi:hypothetical protein